MSFLDKLVEEGIVKAPEGSVTDGAKFLTARDNIGLPTESMSYVKRTCKTCYGRGKVSYLVDDGYSTTTKTSTTPDNKEVTATIRTKNEERCVVSCACMNVGYNRMRKCIEAMPEGSEREAAIAAVV